VIASLVRLHSEAWAGCGFDVARLDVVIVLAADLYREWGAAAGVEGVDGRSLRVGAVSVTPLQQSENCWR
jgi:hypothetical protein